MHGDAIYSHVLTFPFLRPFIPPFLFPHLLASMEPALDRFKNMTELVILVASFLDRDDLASFRLACHSINTICIPFFYRDVELSTPWQCWTTDGIRGLARHPSCVRSLKTDEDSCFLYYASLVKVLTETAPPS